MDPFGIALAQLEPTLYDKAANLSKAERTIRRAAAQRAKVVIFPELYLTGYSLGERAADLAETADGPSVQKVLGLAADCHIAVIMGFAEQDPLTGYVYDSAFAAGPDGRLAGCYQKVHLYQSEKLCFQPGRQTCVMDFGLGPVGLLVCYDLEFPEAARSLALQGAQWIAVCTGNVGPNQHIQEVYIQARAAENRCWVALANQVGGEGQLPFFGRSAAADPFGNLVAQAGGGEELLLVDLDLSLSGQARLNADYLADRRPALYQEWEGG